MRAAALALLLAAAADGGAAGGPGYPATVERWRAEREARLRSADGWLTVAGLFWLTDGEHVVGAGAPIALPEDAAPTRAASLRVRGHDVFLIPARGVDVRVGDRVVPSAGVALRSDRDGASPDVVAVGRLRLTIIERAGQLAVRLRDPERAARKTFTGLTWFPVDPRFRVVARLVAHPAPVMLRLPNVAGKTEEMASPGKLEFVVAGRKLSLVPVLEPGEPRPFLIFRDATTGAGTYGGGRFAYADPQPDGTYVIDFNRAYSPPCAFTPYATCVLPPKSNWLPVAIEAGERAAH